MKGLNIEAVKYASNCAILMMAILRATIPAPPTAEHLRLRPRERVRRISALYMIALQLRRWR